MSIMASIYVVDEEGVRETEVTIKVSPNHFGKYNSVECVTRVNGDAEDTTQEEVDKLKQALAIFAQGLIHYLDSITLEYMMSGDVVTMNKPQQDVELN